MNNGIMARIITNQRGASFRSRVDGSPLTFATERIAPNDDHGGWVTCRMYSSVVGTQSVALATLWLLIGRQLIHLN